MNHADHFSCLRLHRLGLALAAAGLLGGAALAAEPATPTLSNASTPTDGTVSADHRGYAAQQAAIQALNERGGHRLRSYSLAKAQCWLDVSFHEYTRNDRSSFPLAALQQSSQITRYLASGGAVTGEANPARQTPLLNNAPKLRADLWAQVEQLKGQPGARCAEQLLACAEVELVHAGNEHAQQGWRHAQPYVQIAEDRVAEAQAAEAACPPEVVPAVVAPAASAAACPQQPVCQPGEVPGVVPPPPSLDPVPSAPGRVTEKIVIDASLLFKFDRRSANDLLPAARSQLDQLVDKLNREYDSIEHIELVGYTDRLGRWGYNLKLSQDRADAMKSVLQAKGVTTEIVAVGKGSADPLVDCPGARQTPALVQCLQPNRRVEFNITG
ncbi:MAG: OmpA family protein, partial [Leptothrix sp. (in: b-proteobacteria)]